MKVDRLIGVRDSLRAQLLWWLVPPVLAVVVLSALASYTLALRFANNAYDGGLFDAARSLAQQIQFNHEGQPVLELPQAATEIIQSDPYDRVFYRVLSRTGQTIAGRPDVPPPVDPLTADAPVSFYDAKVGDEPVRTAAYSLFDGAGRMIATVLIAETLVKRERLSRNLVLTDLVAPVVTLPVLMAAIIWFGIRRGLRPLQHLTEALAQRGWNDLTVIGHHGAPVEVRPLTGALNDLMRRLGAAASVQQRFIAEAAHQLRTPLAGLTAQTERALLARDIETAKPALEQLLFSSRRISRLVNQLLTLARAEPDSGPACEFEELDLAMLVQQTCRAWVPEALAKEVDLGFDGESKPVMINGDELLLTEILNNLIDNALRYGARPGGAVTVRLRSSPTIELAVIDDGPGIPEEERSRVFDRFHRVPGSAPGGCGLGLAIVREIAHAHGGEACAQSAGPDGGTEIRIVFGQR